MSTELITSAYPYNFENSLLYTFDGEEMTKYLKWFAIKSCS